jgi:YVTN family beta-propeller protein
MRPIIIVLLVVCAGCRLEPYKPTQHVGRISEQKVMLPVSQILTPAGQQVELPKMRPQALALSPNGRLLVTSGKTTNLVVIDPDSGKILQRVSLPSDKTTEPPPDVSSHIIQPEKDAQLSFTGLIFSPDGKRVYLSNVNGSVKVFAVNDGTVAPLFSIPLPKAGLRQRTNEIPSGLASSADGKRLYVVANLSNRLLELEAQTGKVLRSFNVGVAPFDVVLAHGKAYVSNWGGRRPETNSVTGPAGRGTLVRVDPKRHIASEGSVSIVDLSSGRVKEILVGLHASGLALSPSGGFIVVANAASDTVSVIDTSSDSVVETISLKWQPDDYFGASPNALAFDADGKTLYVCNGTQNAVAVVSFRAGGSKLRGLIPVGWFPGAIVHDTARKKLHVANIKGTGSGRRTLPEEPQKFNSHQYFGTLSLVPTPKKEELIRHTRQALANCRREMIEASQLPARVNQPPRPVPERPGEPSVFKHVVYIIKENRTYDQVLGDMKEGNGDPKLCVFGEKITPNQHKIARHFVLLDNTYCSGILSADGHQWSTTAFATDYLEKSFAGFPRSYPDGMDDDDVDAIAYAPSGFIWDNALEHGKTLRVYGEFAIAATGWKDDPKRKPAPKFLDFYRDFKEDTARTFVSSRSAIESLRPYLNTNTIGWGMEVPDVFRAREFIKELRECEKKGNFPNLVIICLPNNHTSGTKADYPTPAASVADNDLAFGQIIEAISHSHFWKETCILAIEDDPQDGWDHVSGYRTTAFVVSPYTKRGKVVNTQYNQPGMLRTIELILGLPPMNAMDAAATSMFDCFTDKPDFTPYTAVTNNIPLDQMNPAPRAIREPLLRSLAEQSSRLPLHKIDACPEEVLNRIIWHAQKGPDAPFPHWAIEKRAGRRKD